MKARSDSDTHVALRQVIHGVRRRWRTRRVLNGAAIALFAIALALLVIALATGRGTPDAGQVPSVASAPQFSEVAFRTHVERLAADEFEGRGVGGRLVAGVLDDIRARGLLVVPLCSFTRSYIERHPEYQDLIAG